jgi:hypothetical protein
MNFGGGEDLLVQIAKDQRGVRSIESVARGVIGYHGMMTFLRNLWLKGSV